MSLLSKIQSTSGGGVLSPQGMGTSFRYGPGGAPQVNPNSAGILSQVLSGAQGARTKMESEEERRRKEAEEQMERLAILEGLANMQPQAMEYGQNVGGILPSTEATEPATSMNPEFDARIQQLIADAKEAGYDVGISSGFRSNEEQAKLWEKYGKDRSRVAPPGHSAHNHGFAADLKYGPGAKEWVHANKDKYGLQFRVAGEDWHAEPKGYHPKMKTGYKWEELI
jgi:hypothetical protein